eukprot:2680244-Rhodomonas_salina.1
MSRAAHHITKLLLLDMVESRSILVLPILMLELLMKSSNSSSGFNFSLVGDAHMKSTPLITRTGSIPPCCSPARSRERSLCASAALCQRCTPDPTATCSSSKSLQEIVISQPADALRVWRKPDTAPRGVCVCQRSCQWRRLPVLVCPLHQVTNLALVLAHSLPVRLVLWKQIGVLIQDFGRFRLPRVAPGVVARLNV